MLVIHNQVASHNICVVILTTFDNAIGLNPIRKFMHYTPPPPPPISTEMQNKFADSDWDWP